MSFCFFFPFPFTFPANPGNDSLWFPLPKCENGLFHSLPVPEFRECLSSFPSRSRNLGMDFLFPSRSRILGMVFFHSLPVPEVWEWNSQFPFPFRTPKSHPRSPLTEIHNYTYTWPRIGIMYWSSACSSSALCTCLFFNCAPLDFRGLSISCENS